MDAFRPQYDPASGGEETLALASPDQPQTASKTKGQGDALQQNGMRSIDSALMNGAAEPRLEDALEPRPPLLSTAAYDEHTDEVGGIGANAMTALQDAVQSGRLTTHQRLRFEVEHCTAARPSMSLRGSSQKYVDTYNEFRECLQSWRPSDERADYSLVHLATCKLSDSHKRRAAGQSNIFSDPCLGAFNIYLDWDDGRGSALPLLLFSKKRDKGWPNVHQLIRDLHQVLPWLHVVRNLDKVPVSSMHKG